MGRVVAAVLPARMGTSFRWLVGSSWMTNLGDGISLAVGPLLVAARTSDPFLVALAGPAVGAVLFTAGTAWPFLVPAVCVVLGAVLVSRMALPPLPAVVAGRRHVGREIVEGLRWTWGNGPVRTLTLTIVSFDVTYGARGRCWCSTRPSGWPSAPSASGC